ncbi:MAG: DevR family CRISPR-associated autoregulator [Candidatus Aminicenantes bacterium]|nr:DevR family CRISPR-associated autoregulator [Candidatus Aminicenantes bacterium]
MAIFEISLLARVTWNLHSLNNEGTIGNVTEPRTVVLANGVKTDGVSGEMLKHIHAYYVWLLAEDKSNFCEACQKFHPQKADKNTKIKRTDTPEKAMEMAISSCVLCDLHGFLIQKPTISRPSTIEFGWALGLPDKTHRGVHIHARHSMEGRVREEPESIEEKAEDLEAEEKTKETEVREVTAQMIYHRPTRSGVYAFVSVFQPWRIGLNEINYNYVISDDERRFRYQLGLNAYKASFMRTDGAMVSTRLPHTENIEGIVAISERNFPVPVISPIDESFDKILEDLANQTPGIQIKRFSNLSQLSLFLDDLTKEELFKLNIP